MKNQNILNAIFIIMVALVIGLACSGTSQSQIDEAHKNADEANRKLDEAKNLFAKTEARNTALFSANIQTPLQLQYYKSRMGNEAKSIVADYEKVVAMMKDVSGNYKNISQMNLNEKYKNYAKLKSDEYATRAEAINICKGDAQAFMDIDDPSTMTTKFDENRAKSNRLFRDAEDLGMQAKKIEAENKEVFARV